MKSGVMPMGSIPTAFSDASVNLHLLPTNESSYDNSVPLTARPEKLGDLPTACVLAELACVYSSWPSW